MKRFLSGVGSLLFGVIWFAGIILLFIGGARIAAWIEPWVLIISAWSLLLGVPISLFLLIFRKSRGWGGLGFYILSWPLGLWVWLISLLYALRVSTFWAIFGVVIGGIGVVPVAAIMTLIRRDWPNFGGLVTALVVALVLRFVGLWIYARAEEREQFEAFRGEQAETLASN